MFWLLGAIVAMVMKTLGLCGTNFGKKAQWVYGFVRFIWLEGRPFALPAFLIHVGMEIYLYPEGRWGEYINLALGLYNWWALRPKDDDDDPWKKRRKKWAKKIKESLSGRLVVVPQGA